MSVWRALRSAVRRLRTMLSRAQFERGMDDEMRHHLDLEIEDRIRKGMRPEEARRTACRDFGGVERYKERARAARGLAGMDAILQDLTFGLRVFRTRPILTATAVATLGLGIGLPTVVFSVAEALLLRPPRGVEDSDRLVQVRMWAPHLDDEETSFSHANLQDLRTMELPALSHLVGWASSRFQAALPGRATAILNGAAPVGDYFGALGVRASEGRLFGEAETRRGADEGIVVISEHARRRLFGQDDAVGRTLTVNGVPLTVIGVAGRGFRGTVEPLDLWVPFPVYPRLRHREVWTYYERSATNLHDMVARLAPGASADEAERQLRRGMDRLVERHPEVNAAYADYAPTLFRRVGVSPFTYDRLRAAVMLLLVAGGLVLLVACANVANLLIFSGVRRRGESATRRALGASRARLVRQHLTESGLLAAGGIAAGLLVAWLLLELGSAWVLPPSPDPSPLELDLRVAGFAVAAGVASVLVAGLLPALTVGRFRLSEVLKESGRAHGGRKARLRRLLTVAQLAVSLGLVVGALLLDRTVRNLYAVELGFETEGVARVRIDPEPQGYEPGRADALRSDVLRLARDLPGVESVGGAAEGPMHMHMSADLRSGDDPGDDWPVDARQDEVTPGYFETLGIPVLRGRSFSSQELTRSFEGDAGVAVVSETLARRLFGRLDAVGRTVVSRGFRASTTLEVVGVVADHRTRSLDGPVGPVLYRPLGDGFSRGMVLFARSRRPPTAVVQALRAVLDGLDPALPFYEAGPLEERLAAATAEPRLLARLVGFLAVVAGLLAAVGLYGVVAYSVVERKREIGIRMAMGAGATRVVGRVLRQSLALVAVGVATGAGVAWLLTRLLQRWLFGVGTLDPTVWTAVPAAFLLLGMLAAWAPARAATRVDPTTELRS